MLEQQNNQLKGRIVLDEKQKKKRGRPHLLKVSPPSEKVAPDGNQEFNAWL